MVQASKNDPKRVEGKTPSHVVGAVGQPTKIPIGKGPLGFIRVKVVKDEPDSPPIANAEYELKGPAKKYVGGTDGQGVLRQDKVPFGWYQLKLKKGGRAKVPVLDDAGGMYIVRIRRRGHLAFRLFS